MGFVKRTLHKTKTVTFEYKTQTKNVTTLEMSEPTWTDLFSSQCLFWQGSKADRLVSEKLRPDVTGVIVIDYADATSTIPDDCRALIDGVYYSVIYANNVAGQNQIWEIPVKKYVS